MQVRVVWNGSKSSPVAGGAWSQADAKQRPRRGGERNPRSFTVVVIHSLVARLLTAARVTPGYAFLMIYRARAETCISLLRAKVRRLPRGPTAPFPSPSASCRSCEVQMEAQMLRFNPVTVLNCTVPLVVERRDCPSADRFRLFALGELCNSISEVFFCFEWSVKTNCCCNIQGTKKISRRQ